MSVADVSKRVLRLMDDQAPLILTSLGVAGVLSTVILAVKVTPEAIRIVKHRQLTEYRFEKQEAPEPTKLEIIKWSWQLYIPAAGMGAITIACIIGAQSINSRRQAALISGFTLMEGAFKEYREKVVEKLGEKKENAVHDELAQDRVSNNPVSNQLVITGKGDVLCYDTESGHYFNCDMQTLRKAQNDINLQCINSMYASQNEFYAKIGIPQSKFGDEFGWTTDHPLDLRFSATLSDDDLPCMVISYGTEPVRGYNKFG